MANIGGTTGDDTLVGTYLADRINGGDGNDWIYGGGGADLLYGGNGDDYIDSGIGADYIVGGAGNDAMLGREGADVFAFWFKLVLASGQEAPHAEGGSASTDVNLVSGEGYDVILDFDTRAGQDKLDFNGIKSAQWDYLVSSGQMTYSHADYTGDGNIDMMIAWNGGSLVLSGVNATQVADLWALKGYVLFDP